MKRREFLGAISLPFFRPRHMNMAGAKFRIIRNGRSKRRYLLIHGNEETARQVLLRHMETQEGIAYVVESRTRTAPVAGLKVDPNRMFSRVGAQTSLERLNRDAEEGVVSRAMAELDRGREHMVHALTPPRGGLTIALHNNSAGYSVTDEVPISDETSLREPRNPHAFFLCTDPKDFDIRVENHKTGAGVRITADRALWRVNFWSIRTTVCPEAYVEVKADPGKETSWKLTYDFYSLPTKASVTGN